MRSVGSGFAGERRWQGWLPWVAFLARVDSRNWLSGFRGGFHLARGGAA